MKECKYKIDYALQRSMFEVKEEHWDAILTAKDRLYEQFNIYE